jgi:hypothetical protein
MHIESSRGSIIGVDHRKARAITPSAFFQLVRDRELCKRDRLAQRLCNDACEASTL